MFLAIDIGNSNIVIAIHNGQSWSNVFRYETKDDQASSYYKMGLLNILLEWGIKPSDILLIGVSSVVPDLNNKILQAIHNTLNGSPVLITPEFLMELDMKVPRPYEIGTDLVANAYAAIKKYQSNAIVVDFGTALTFTVVDKIEGIKGVTIAPGLKTALQALSGNTAQLPLVDFAIPASAIGQNTSHAIQAGISIGYKGLIHEIILAIRSELQSECKVIATGGLSGFVTSLGSLIDIHDRNLTLDGIRLMVERK